MKLRSFISFLAMAAMCASCAEYVKVDTFEEAADPVALTPEAEAAWDQVGLLNLYR